ncbi:hypothetical protein KKG41_04595 [Patescibacteria group bacterium]|nr:hypothetical protein [Patescibacteria group bacterium]
MSKKITLVVVGIVVVIFVAAFLLVGHQVPFTNAVVTVPLLEKSPDRVLSLSKDMIAEINSASTEIDISFDVRQIGESVFDTLSSESISGDINVQADTDMATNNTQGEVLVTLDLEGVSVSAELEMKSIDQVNYIKINSLPDIPGLSDYLSLIDISLDDYLDTWFSFDQAGIEDATSDLLSGFGDLGLDEMVNNNINSATEEINQEELTQKILDLTKDSRFYSFGKRLPDEFAGGVKCYRYELQFNSEEFGTYIEELFDLTSDMSLGGLSITSIQPADEISESIADQLDNLSGTIWVGKKDFYPRQVTIDYDMSGQDEYSGNVTVNVELSTINEEVSIEAPDQATSLIDLLSDLMSAFFYTDESINMSECTWTDPYFCTINSWQYVLSGVPGADGSAGTVSREDYVYEGHYAGYVNDISATSSNAIMQLVEVNPDSTYTFSGKYKKIDGDQFQLFVKYYDEDFTLSSNNSKDIEMTDTEWQDFTYSTNSDETAMYAMVIIYSSGENQVELAVDNPKLVLENSDDNLLSVPGFELEWGDTMGGEDLDTDGDGLTNYLEDLYGTNKTKIDTDGDTYSDLVEIEGGYNPLGEGKMTEEQLEITEELLQAALDEESELLNSPESRDMTRKADLRTMQSAVELYVNENGSVPLNDSDPSWDELFVYLNDFFASNKLIIPPGLSDCNESEGDVLGNCYVYCENGEDYLLKTNLENADDISGDLDGQEVSYDNETDCVTSSDGSFDTLPSISCDDPAFCLGTL